MTFYGVTDLLTYTLGSIGIVLIPGPNSLYVLTTATARGLRVGYRAACGVFTGDMILMVLTSLGAAGLLQTFPFLFTVLKYAGAAYLAYMGVQLLRSAWQKWRSQSAVMQAQQAPQAVAIESGDPFKKAMIISLLNPKALLFLLSFFVQFVDPSYPYPLLSFSILTAIVMALSFIYLSALIFLGSRLAQTFARQQKLTALIAASVGGLFIWFGAKLANASLQ